MGTILENIVIWAIGAAVLFLCSKVLRVIRADPYATRRTLKTIGRYSLLTFGLAAIVIFIGIYRLKMGF